MPAQCWGAQHPRSSLTTSPNPPESRVADRGATPPHPCRGRPHLVEVGILRGRQPEATLPALEGHQARQQAVGDVHIVPKVVLHVVRHCPQPVGQLLGFDGVELSLVPLQALQLPAGREEGVSPQWFLPGEPHGSQRASCGVLGVLWGSGMICETTARAGVLAVVVTWAGSVSGRERGRQQGITRMESSLKAGEVQLKRSGSSQPFSSSQCLTAAPEAGRKRASKGAGHAAPPRFLSPPSRTVHQVTPKSSTSE